MNIATYFRVVRARLVLVIAFTLLSTAGYVSFLLVTPAMYQSTARVYLAPAVTSPDGDLQSFAQVQQLTSTYAVIASSSAVLGPVGSGLKHVQSPSELKQVVTAASVEGTSTIEIEVKAQSPNVADAIANGVAATLPRVATGLQSSSGDQITVNIIDPGHAEALRTLPGILSQSGLAGLIGLAVGLALVALLPQRAALTRDELRG